MEKQVIISISREFGSGGHKIANKIAQDLDLPVYDKNILEEITKEKNVSLEKLDKYDEKPKSVLFTKNVNGHSNSMEENVARLQFEYLKNKADSGESFVVVGRCAETVLKGRKELISVFILGDEQDKCKRIAEKYQIDEQKAILKMKRHDIRRKLYHNQYSKMKWGDSRNYDLCLNSSRLGMDKIVDMIEKYIDKRIEVQ